MLKRANGAGAGFSLIELLVVISLIGILMAIAVPTFGKWTADASLRTVAENLANAIRQTQTLAISRGRTGMFALTADTPPTTSSTPAANSPNWFAELNALAPDEPAANVGVMLKATDATARSVTINGPALICFNSVGRQSNAGVSLGNCTVQPSDVDATGAPTPTKYTLSRTGATRKFQVQVFLGGRVRMCDLSKTLSATNPDGC
jgi:type IV fimbrial biogenesis protein FimT